MGTTMATIDDRPVRLRMRDLVYIIGGRTTALYQESGRDLGDYRVGERWEDTSQGHRVVYLYDPETIRWWIDERMERTRSERQEMHARLNERVRQLRDEVAA